MGKAIDIVERLDPAGLKPETLYADGGYPSVPTAFKIAEKNVEFISPVNRAQLSKEIMGRDHFKFDSEGSLTQCPMGHKPIDHRILSANNTTNRAIHAIFEGDVCRACKILDQCPVRAPNHRVRGCKARDTVGNFRLEVTPQLLLRDQMYSKQQTDEWKGRYKIRSGIEATMSELIRSHGFRKLRVRKAPKVSFAVTCKLIACNIKRWARACEGLERLFYRLMLYIINQSRQLQLNTFNINYLQN